VHLGCFPQVFCSVFGAPEVLTTVSCLSISREDGSATDILTTVLLTQMDPGTALLRRCVRRVAGVEREGRLAGVAKRPGSDVTAWSVLEVRLSTRPPYPSRAGAPVQFFLRPLCVDLPRPGHRGPRIPCSSPAHQLCVSSARRKRRDKACCWWCAAVDGAAVGPRTCCFSCHGGDSEIQEARDPASAAALSRRGSFHTTLSRRSLLDGGRLHPD